MRARAAVVAADIASGVAADTGAVLGRAVRADRTVTFTLPKIGSGSGGRRRPAPASVEVRDIGIPADLVRGLVCRAQTVERDFVPVRPCRRRRVGRPQGNLRQGADRSAAQWAIPVRRISPPRRRCGPAAGWCPWGCRRLIWPVEAAKCVSAMPFPLPDKHGRLSRRRRKSKSWSGLAGCDAAGSGPWTGPRRDGVTELVLGSAAEDRSSRWCWTPTA